MAQALVSFFAIIDPLGNILVFHLLTQKLTFRQKVIVALVTCVAAFLLLLAFSLAGQESLEFLGITSDSFQVAAGLLLLPPAYRLVMEGQPATVNEGEEHDLLEFALVPLATPLIAGPGALAAAASFAQTKGEGTTIAAFAAILLLTLASFVLADVLFRFVGAAVLRLIARVVGIVLFAIAVDFVLEGSRNFFEVAQIGWPLLAA